MPLAIPPAVNYPSPLVAIPSNWNKAPPEGSRTVSCEILWATMGGASKVVNFDLQSKGTLPISQIVALKVDNSACGADVQFIFPDTGDTVTIPALSAEVITPVFTQGQQFFVLGEAGVDTADVTRFQVLNFMPPPLAVPRSAQLDTVNQTGLTTTNQSGTALVDPSVSGTLEYMYVDLASTTTVIAPSGNFQVRENSAGGRIIWAVNLAVAATATNLRLISANPLNSRFVGGLVMNLSGVTTAGDGRMTVNLAYRTP